MPSQQRPSDSAAADEVLIPTILSEDPLRNRGPQQEQSPPIHPEYLEDTDRLLASGTLPLIWLLRSCLGT